jgi:hypothetical protein
MNYITHNEEEVSISGTCGRGGVACDYNKLVQTFGQPSEHFDDFKSDAEWDLYFDDGSIVTIYNWKNGINYCGPEDGTPTELITEWNVGGNTPHATRLVMECLEGLHHRGITVKV